MTVRTHKRFVNRDACYLKGGEVETKQSEQNTNKIFILETREAMRNCELTKTAAAMRHVSRRGFRARGAAHKTSSSHEEPYDPEDQAGFETKWDEHVFEDSTHQPENHTGTLGRN